MRTISSMESGAAAPIVIEGAAPPPLRQSNVELLSERGMPEKRPRAVATPPPQPEPPARPASPPPESAKVSPGAEKVRLWSALGAFRGTFEAIASLLAVRLLLL